MSASKPVSLDNSSEIIPPYPVPGITICLKQVHRRKVVIQESSDQSQQSIHSELEFSLYFEVIHGSTAFKLTKG